MEKRGIIEEGRTPPEATQESKQASNRPPLEEHVTKRVADAAKDCIDANRNRHG